LNFNVLVIKSTVETFLTTVNWSI